MIDWIKSRAIAIIRRQGSEEPRGPSPAERLRPELRKICDRFDGHFLCWSMQYGDCKATGDTPEEAETRFNKAWSTKEAW